MFKHIKEIGGNVRLAQCKLFAHLKKFFMTLEDLINRENKRVEEVVQEFSNLQKRLSKELEKIIVTFIQKNGDNNKLDIDYIEEIYKSNKGKKVKRIMTLLDEIEEAINEIIESDLKLIKTKLYKDFESAYYNQLYEISKKINTGMSFEPPNRQMILNIIFANWTDKNLNGIMYAINENLIKTIRNELLTGIALGENSLIIADRVSKKTNILKSKSETIIRTEMTRILNEGSFKASENLNDMLGGDLFEKYKILATLDSRTSEVCQEMDGKEFDIKNKVVGVTFPPLHPRCRSSFITIIDEEGIKERISKRLDTNEYEYIPSNITYKDWKEKFIKK